MDIDKVMKLQRFFDILNEQGEDAAVKYAEEVTGRKIEDLETKKPRLRIVDEADD